eukprot:SAG11_NODE_6004_length_1412_cov_1.086062_2_plen_43_part_01
MPLACIRVTNLHTYAVGPTRRELDRVMSDKCLGRRDGTTVTST